MLKKERGNTLVLTLVSIGVIVLLVAFFALNYNQIFGGQKQAQSAIDAAALQAAQDMAKVVISDPVLGTIGVVDNVPPNGNWNLTPAVGINTIMGTIRLDMVIAGKMGNTSMMVLAAEDMQDAIVASRNLRQAILNDIQTTGQVLAKDQSGNSIDIVGDATTAYNVNAVRLSKGQLTSPLTINVGESSYSGQTSNIPVPSLLAGDPYQVSSKQAVTVNGITAYTPYTSIDTNVNGTDFQFEFAGLGSQPALVPNDNFTAYAIGDTSGWLAPACVQVQASQSVQAIATVSGSSKSTGNTTAPGSSSTSQTLQMVATAQCGAQPVVFPSGTLMVSFSGFTSEPQPNGALNFDNVQNIMNASQIQLNPGYSPPQILVSKVVNATEPPAADAGNIGTASPYTNWNGASPGAWYVSNGTVSAGESGAVQGSLSSGQYNGRSSDDPSVVLSFEVYDWLRHLYLRPNVNSVVSTLSGTMWTTATASRGNTNMAFIPPAYAEATSNNQSVSFVFTDVPKDGVGDPRNIKSLTPDVQARQIANLFSYVPAAPTLPDGGLAYTIKGTKVQTVNGQPAQTLSNFWAMVVKLNNIAAQSQKAASTVLNGPLPGGGPGMLAQANTLQQQMKQESPSDPNYQAQASQLQSAGQAVGRALACLHYASQGNTLSLALFNDMKTITSLGITEIDAQTFTMMSGNSGMAASMIYAPTQFATVSAILNGGVVSTGQDAGAPYPDWCTPSVKNVYPAIFFVPGGGKATISLHPGDNTFWQPAMAQSASSSSNELQLFQFSVAADGTIVTTSPLSSPYGVAIPNQQIFYQNTAGYTFTDSSSGLTGAANVVARDLAYSGTGTYFSDETAAGAVSPPTTPPTPALASEWSLRCPAFPPPPPPPCVGCTTPTTTTPQCTTCMSSEGILVPQVAGTISNETVTGGGSQLLLFGYLTGKTESIIAGTSDSFYYNGLATFSLHTDAANNTVYYGGSGDVLHITTDAQLAQLLATNGNGKPFAASDSTTTFATYLANSNSTTLDNGVKNFDNDMNDALTAYNSAAGTNYTLADVTNTPGLLTQLASLKTSNNAAYTQIMNDLYNADIDTRLNTTPLTSTTACPCVHMYGWSS